MSPTITQALRAQWRTILALILRETHTRFGDTKLGYFWAVFESVMHVAVFAIIFVVAGRSSPLEGDTPFFFATGLVPFFLFSNITSRVMVAYSSNQALFSFPQVTPFDACFSRYLLEFASSIFVFFLICAALYLLNSSVYIENIVQFSLSLLCASLLGFSTGVTNANILIFLPSYAQLYSVCQRMLYFASGIFFVAESLPSAAQEILSYNPLLHCVEWARSALYPNFQSKIVNIEYILWWILCTLFFALFTQRKLYKHARNIN